MSLPSDLTAGIAIDGSDVLIFDQTPSGGSVVQFSTASLLAWLAVQLGVLAQATGFADAADLEALDPNAVAVVVSGGQTRLLPMSILVSAAIAAANADESFVLLGVPIT
jgi:hypothetical protein